MTASQARPEFLLLLTPTPWLPTPQRIKDAYSEPIRAVLTQLSAEFRKSPVGATLDIAVPVPYLYEHAHEPRAGLYETVQKLVARIYRLVCIIAAAENVQLEDVQGIDVRLQLIAHSRTQDLQATAAKVAEPDYEYGPSISLQTLARSQRPWQTIFSVDDLQGKELLRQFVTAQESRVRIGKVPSGTTQADASDADGISTASPRHNEHHRAIAVGGTWDHIHIGHKLLLTMFAFLLQDPLDVDGDPLDLTVGITGDELLKNKKHAEVLESWQQRQQSVLDFLRGIMDFRPPSAAHVQTIELNNPGPNGHAVDVQFNRQLKLRLVEIADPFGPTITDKDITALVLSGETRGGGQAVNEKRAERGWPALQVFEIDVLDAAEEMESDGQLQEDFASKLSSTAIRQRLSEMKVKSKA